MKIEWKSCFKIGVSIFLLYLCIHYWSSVSGIFAALFGAAAPLLIGCVIAYLINILMSIYEKHYFPNAKKAFFRKSRRPVCMIAAFITLVAVVVLIVVLIVPQLFSCVQLLLGELPDVISAGVALLDKMNILPADIEAALNTIDWQSRIEQIFNMLTSGIGNAVNIIIDTVTSVFSGIVTAFMALIFSFYLLMGKDKLKSQADRIMVRYMKPKLYDKVMYMLGIVNDCFRRYIIGQCTEAIILGVLCTIGMWILRLPYAPMIGALIAFTALIPVAGAYIGGGIGAFMIFTVSPIQAVVFVIFLVVLQQLENNLIYPRVVGSSMGLPGIWVLAAVTIGEGIMGVPGMLLSVPIAAAVYRLLRNELNKPVPAASEQ